MKHQSQSQLLLIKEITQTAQKTNESTKGLSIGSLIKMIRTQLGLSQRILAKRAQVPQSTISRIEQGKAEINISKLNKILHATSCKLVIAPLLLDSIDAIRRKQAHKIAKKRIGYLKGTMNLEAQQPDTDFVEELLKEEEQRLLLGPSSELWEE
jgi:transcriptional regulator with XRE-family HTH domain